MIEVTFSLSFAIHGKARATYLDHLAIAATLLHMILNANIDFEAHRTGLCHVDALLYIWETSA